ncbi:MAG: hypothetical protein BMS9Abin13_521 [Patescibacteria group bacterium]|nr:MAG: hypothetical protein BMS9Abin13_521 [Patescibacteria group bacterium]
MFNHLERIQRKPEYVRRRILLVTTVALFFIIVFVWFLFPGSSLVDNTEENTVYKELSPFSNIEDAFNSAVDNIGDGFGSLKGSLAGEALDVDE